MRDLAKPYGMRRGLLAGVLAGCLAVSACATPDSDTYTSSDVGQTIETSQGRVLSSRPVDIKSEEGGTAGTLAGGAVGGAAGYGVGSGSGQLLATVIGAVVGASIGYLAEKEIRSGEGIEYIVELEDGRVVTLVQNRAGDEQPIADGEPVLVQFGSQYTRIRPLDSDSTGAATGSGAGSGGGWVNPDAEAGSEGAGGGSVDVSDPAATSEPIDLNSGQGQQE